MAKRQPGKRRYITVPSGCVGTEEMSWRSCNGPRDTRSAGRATDVNDESAGEIGEGDELAAAGCGEGAGRGKAEACDSEGEAGKTEGRGKRQARAKPKGPVSPDSPFAPLSWRATTCGPAEEREAAGWHDAAGKLGVVDVGGGMRGVFGAGVFDRLLDEGLWFDYCAGVSAGSANLTSYLAGQRGRNFKFYTDYAFRPEYMSWGNLLRSGNYINLDYIYSELSDEGGEYPLDFAALAERATPYEIVVTDAHTGRPDYIPAGDMGANDYGAIKGSCCVPGVNRPYAWGGGLWFDGGSSDPIPFERAFSQGCDRVVVVLTRPRDFRRDPKNEALTVRLVEHKYPQAAETLRHRAEVYNRQLEEALRLEQEGRVLVVAPKPESVAGLKTLTKDRDAMVRLYEDGYNAAGAVLGFARK